MNIDQSPSNAIQNMIEESFPLKIMRENDSVFSYREAGSILRPTICLLHGIGSASGSWIYQLQGLSENYHIIAWDAPGYGKSSNINTEKPEPSDYASALNNFIKNRTQCLKVLIGHSLGALIAGAYVAQRDVIDKILVLADPANGYGASDPHIRSQILEKRLANMRKLGPEGLANARSTALLSESSSSDAKGIVHYNMKKLNIKGHNQAAHMLAKGDLKGTLGRFHGSTLILCGSEDTITPETKCKEIANIIPNAEYRTLYGAGHASYIEKPNQFNNVILDFVVNSDA